MSLTPDGIGHIEYASESYAGPHGSGLLEEDTRYSPASSGHVQHQQLYNLTAYVPQYDLHQEHQQLYLSAESEQIEVYYQQDAENHAQHEVYIGLQPGLPLRFETYGEYVQEEQLAAYQQPSVYEEQPLSSQEQFPDQEQHFVVVEQETPPPSLPEQEVAGVEQFVYQEQLPYEEQLPSQQQFSNQEQQEESPPPSHSEPAPNRTELFLSFAQSPGTEHLLFLQAPNREELFLSFAQTPGADHTQFDLLANSVRESLRYIRENCELLTAEHNREEVQVHSEINAIILLRYKLLDVYQLLVDDDNNPQAWSLCEEIAVGFESETLLKLSERRLNGARRAGSTDWPYNWNSEQANPMGLDLLKRIRNILNGWVKHNDTPSDPDEAGSGSGSGSGPAGDQQQPSNRSFPRKRRTAEDEPPLIKYRRVDNSFPRFIPNEAAAEDYTPTRSMAERERERESQRQSAKRLSIFNAPTITQRRVRNNAPNIAIDLSDDDELFSPSYGLGASYRPPPPPPLAPTGDSSTTSSLAVRPQLLYSDAVRLGQNGFPESRMMNGHHAPRSSPPHVEDSLLNQEERRSERDQYLALLRNLCHDKSAIRTTSRPNPPPLQLLNRPAEPATWGSILAGNRPLPAQQQQPPPPLPSRAVNNHSNRELSDYARLLEREQRKITPQPPPLMRINSPRSITSHASTLSSTESISSSSSSEGSDVVQAIDDSSDGEGQAVPLVNHNGPLHSTSSPLNTTVALADIMQRRFANSVFFKDNFAEDFKLKIERQRKEIDHRRELAQCEANKSRDARRAFEQSMRESMIQFRLVHKPLLVIGSVDKAAEKKESEFIPLTEEHMKRYTELIQGAAHQVLVTKFSLQIHRSDIRTLLGSSWLNDEVINFYMNLLTERSELRAGELPSVYAMNTFFVPRLLQTGHGGVKRWTRKVDLFSKDIIPVPVHCNGVHWCMAIIHMRNKTIRYYDSMGKPNQNVLDALESYLRQESLDKRKQPFDTSDFKIESVPNVPQQTNGSDCGVFSCMFAEYITRDAPITFAQEHMDYFRKKMVLEIAGGQLWL